MEPHETPLTPGEVKQRCHQSCHPQSAHGEVALFSRRSIAPCCLVKDSVHVDQRQDLRVWAARAEQGRAHQRYRGISGFWLHALFLHIRWNSNVTRSILYSLHTVIVGFQATKSKARINMHVNEYAFAESCRGLWGETDWCN